MTDQYVEDAGLERFDAVIIIAMTDAKGTMGALFGPSRRLEKAEANLKISKIARCPL